MSTGHRRTRFRKRGRTRRKVHRKKRKTYRKVHRKKRKTYRRVCRNRRKRRRAQFGGAAPAGEGGRDIEEERRAEEERIAREEAMPTKLQEVQMLEGKIKKGIKYVEKYAGQMHDIAHECAVQEEEEQVEGKGR